MIRILFICSGNKAGQPSPVIYNQAKALEQFSCSINFYLVKGKGPIGYLKNIKNLKKTQRLGDHQIIHAHGFSSFVASFIRKKPLVVSLLGSELLQHNTLRWFFRIMSKFYWARTIVKTREQAEIIGFSNNKRVFIIPNGVDLERITLIDKTIAKEKVGFSLIKPTVLFLADPLRKSKNFTLAQEATKLISEIDFDFKVVWNSPIDMVPYYLNASDVVVLSSLWEGSPNVVKEAMACNTPIVSTCVGDVKTLFEGTKGCFIASFNNVDFASKIKEALSYAKEYKYTNGRERIVELGLDSSSISARIIGVYNDLIRQK